MRRDEWEYLAEEAGFSAWPNDSGLGSASGDQIMIVRSIREE